MACKKKTSIAPGKTLTDGHIHWFQSDEEMVDANEAGTETDDDDDDDDDESLGSTINDSLFAEILQELKESDAKSYSSAETSSQEEFLMSAGIHSMETRRAAVVKRSHSADAKPYSVERYNTLDMTNAALHRSLSNTQLRSLLDQKQSFAEYFPAATDKQLNTNKDITEKDPYDEAPHGLTSVSLMLQRCMQTSQSQWHLDSNEIGNTLAYETNSTNRNRADASKVFCDAETGFNYRFQPISDENINTWEECQQQDEKRKLWWLSNDSVTGIKKEQVCDGPNKIRMKERSAKSLNLEDRAATEANHHWSSVEHNEQGERRSNERAHQSEVKGSSEEILQQKQTRIQQTAMKDCESHLPGFEASFDHHIKQPKRATMKESQTRAIKSPIVKREPKLYIFLQKILEDPEQYSCVEWVDKPLKIFRIKNTAAIASLWGRKKNKPNMKYEHFARTLRGYIARGLLKKPRKKLVYQFNYEK